ncbi:hypothetical protein MUA01_15195 [Enterobacteriaceae bacterium H18W14]|uniref:hypothetical protein n=1 Tax=Dryocola boscaweniae TaxID=2925397 RepID=UPI0022F1209F|nr:hypothetical protein [Dryocola boscaweniae]MCT4716307.1 hypothetical protein [Dryocola boscaweniae]
MIGMLYELLFVLADDLKAPRFVRVAGGLMMIEGEAVLGFIDLDCIYKKTLSLDGGRGD